MISIRIARIAKAEAKARAKEYVEVEGLVVEAPGPVVVASGPVNEAPGPVVEAPEPVVEEGSCSSEELVI